jgi:isocitrate dehydrogenase (NAD+)
MAHNVTLIPGDGVGPEVTEATKRVLEATGVKFNWEIGEVGSYAMEKYGTPLPAYVIESVKKNKVALKGPVTTPVGSGFRSVNVALRKELELFVCLRPCKTYPGVPSRFKDIDLIMVRENLEDLYAGIEFEKGTPEAADLNLSPTLKRAKSALIPESASNLFPNSAANAS